MLKLSRLCYILKIQLQETLQLLELAWNWMIVLWKCSALRTTMISYFQH
jgi:hypothetical protein